MNRIISVEEEVSPEGTKKEKTEKRKIDMDNWDSMISENGKYMPNKLPFGAKLQDEEASPLKEEKKVINIKRTKLEKDKYDNEPLNLGPPDIESDEEDHLQNMLLN